MPMLIGNTTACFNNKPVNGQFVNFDGEAFYQIEHFDAMPPFFISLASDTDLWMYIASTGGLTCGRKSPDNALFPYYTDEKITENYGNTGPRTIVRLIKDADKILWQPFSNQYKGVYNICRRIAKSVVGNKLLFQEDNLTLGLRFQYLWTSAQDYGWIRKASIENLNDYPIEVEVLDGLQNILPAGVDRLTQNTYSTLVDGYKKTEQVADSSLLLFRMEAIMVDRAEPSESLRCNTVYVLGLNNNATYLTSNQQVSRFEKGEDIFPEPESKGVRGAIFVAHRAALMVGAKKQWYFVADVEKDACDVKNILAAISANDAINQLNDAIAKATATLKNIVEHNDGIQHTNDECADARHFANVLFNTMRGGFYVDNYTIYKSAFAKHIALFNKALAQKYQDFLNSLPDEIQYGELQARVAQLNDQQLIRLTNEYLPLTFSRRHGDPSRPWNMFNIRVNDANGKRLISYQGNWRDIFQNWEALSISYPDYINAIIAKFLNATTIDGYNPYKISSEGIDWEVINPADPWSNIGYWGDHQIVYLLKLLQLSFNHHPQELISLISQPIFAFANVPYRLHNYAEILHDPKNSITFDTALHLSILKQVPEYGQDARLILHNGQPLLTTLTDKLLITLLTKLSNFVPEAGIWMNTLRPEWNDANNALVGNGASMVTLCYMRRFVAFMLDFYKTAGYNSLSISAHTMQFLHNIQGVINEHQHGLKAGFSDKQRRAFIDGVGAAGETYRNAVYNNPYSQTVQLEYSTLSQFLLQILDLIDESIRANKRNDGLYNAYNIIHFTQDEVHIQQLYQMLEGQVAVLTSYALNPEETIDLLRQLRLSDIYRNDQNSYMLYPARRRPNFLEKNNIPLEVNQWDETPELIEKGIFSRDCEGKLHFNADFHNAQFLSKAASGLPEATISKLLNLYEQVFCHREFTGRSGTFYKYEGLGCIYWHMVSKLLLAVGENITRFEDNIDEQMLQSLREYYYAIREGIGAHKSPAEYGSFPFDPYSHTPAMAGVQQPGMTGQVKEDIINRFFELGIRVENGTIRIVNTMLKQCEFTGENQNASNNENKDNLTSENPTAITSEKLSFTYCAVPFTYTLNAPQKGIFLQTKQGLMHYPQLQMDANISAHIFARDGFVENVCVNF